MGLFRGPDGQVMNATIPLWLNEEHGERVIAQIKPILGYLFTLDPLGFKVMCTNAGYYQCRTN